MPSRQHIMLSLVATLMVGCGLPMLGETECGALGPGECDIRSDCTFLFAAPLVENRCLGEMEPMGCTSRLDTCHGEPSTELDGAGECWLFRNGCRPAGWRGGGRDDGGGGGPCPADKIAAVPSCGESAVSCDTLDEESCLGEISCRPVYARPFDDVDACTGPTLPVACVARTEPTCRGQSTSVRRHGECWLFQQECVPDDWRTTVGESLSGCGVPDVWDAPLCND